MKINEVNKVTTLKTSECITAIAEDGSLIQIPVSELGKVLENMMPSFGFAFKFKQIIIRTGETKVIGRVSGLMLINFPWSDHLTKMYMVTSLGKRIELLNGIEYNFLDFSFNNNNEILVSSRYTATSGNTALNVAYQDIIH